jgi:hypothetical protein
LSKFKLQLGVNECSNREYHSDKSWLSSSSFKKVKEDPAKFYQEEILGNRKVEEEKDHLTEGSLTHSLILEPHLVQTEYARFDGLRRAGAEWEAFRAAPENQGKTLLTKSMWAKAQAYHRAYQGNDEAVELIEHGGLSEHTVCQIFNYVPTKVRADRINIERGFIADVKTSSFSVDRDSAIETVKRWKYELSAALYAAIFEQFYNKPFDFYWIFIAKQDLECRVYKMSDETRMRGLKMYKEGLDIYQHCLATDKWITPNIEKYQQTDIEEI